MVKRPIALMLLLITIPQLNACAFYRQSSIRSGDLRPEDRGAPALELKGVTVTDGQSFIFDSVPPPRFERDTVFASREGVPYRIPRPTIQELLVARHRGAARSVSASSLDEAADSVLGRRIFGVTLRGGERLTLDRDEALVVHGDTIYGTVNGQARRIPLAEVDRVLVRRVDTVKSAAATGLLVVVTAAFVAGLAATGASLFSGGTIRFP
jgi:hypothetical protein